MVDGVEASPASRERAMAAGMHVASIFFPLLGPAVAYVAFGRSSRFVRAHSLQAIYETIVLNVVLFVVGAISVCYTAFRLWNLYQHHWQGFSWVEFVVRFAVGWVLLTVLGLINTAISVRQALLALQGNWPKRSLATRRALPS